MPKLLPSFEIGNDVAGIGDDKIRREDQIDRMKIGMNIHQDLPILGQQLQQLDPGEIHVVIFSADDERAANRFGKLHDDPLQGQNSQYCSKPSF
jgi:hypothetical protein